MNTAGKIYTSKPPLTLSHQYLCYYFDCKCYYFKTLEDATRAIDRAKESSKIITVLNATVYYRNANYEQEKEEAKQAFLQEYERNPYDFVPFFLNEHEFELEYLGLSHLLETTGI